MFESWAKSVAACTESRQSSFPSPASIISRSRRASTSCWRRKLVLVHVGLARARTMPDVRRGAGNTAADGGRSVAVLAMLNHGSRGLAVRTVSYTHLRAHETPEHLVCRLLLEKK